MKVYTQFDLYLSNNEQLNYWEKLMKAIEIYYEYVNPSYAYVYLKNWTKQIRFDAKLYQACHLQQTNLCIPETYNQTNTKYNPTKKRESRISGHNAKTIKKIIIIMLYHINNRFLISIYCCDFTFFFFAVFLSQNFLNY
ncbi:hypothetical protein pb186bvf_001876 [Paramecium bursaria]